MSLETAQSPAALIATQLGVRIGQVEAAIALFDEGATVPFVARYRKEVTGGLSDDQLRLLDQRLRYLRELQSRRDTIIAALKEQGQLSESLLHAVLQADSKTRLEDLYAPYKSSRRSKAQVAQEAGLAPLLQQLLAGGRPAICAKAFVDPVKGVVTVEDALTGAADIMVERLALQADLVQALREALWQQGEMVSVVVPAKREAAAKFRDYFDFREAVSKMPSHRVLALLRGQAEGLLRLKISTEDQDQRLLTQLSRAASVSPANEGWLTAVVERGWRERLRPTLEKQLLKRLREAAEQDSIDVFARNLKQLLLGAPAGPRVTLGLDPGLRTGVKVAVVDDTGKLLECDTLYPHPPRNSWTQSQQSLAELCRRHGVELVAIGNGTGSKETEAWVTELRQRWPELGLTPVMVSEAGASVYSASALAAQEFPQLDVTLRGAVSIARRLQDPLAELVKIDPRSIGVGQYQHDVDQKLLSAALDGVVEDCVNAVGVDLNTASETLLAHVSGLTPTLAANIVAHRDQQGAFRDRRQLLKVARLGPKAYEQAAGFLRILQGDNPLDASAVHPESYPLVERIAARFQRGVKSLIGDGAFLRQLDVRSLAANDAGEFTLRDILAELEKPGRDPRPEFRTARFDPRVSKPADLQPGMLLEGVVTNVANFGAFVDVGVHQDGLVHISHLADRFIKDPHQVVSPGQIVKVRVLEVDLVRQRISLSMKTDAEPVSHGPERERKGGAKSFRGASQTKTSIASQGALAAQLAEALKRR